MGSVKTANLVLWRDSEIQFVIRLSFCQCLLCVIYFIFLILPVFLSNICHILITKELNKYSNLMHYIVCSALNETDQFVKPASGIKIMSLSSTLKAICSSSHFLGCSLLCMK